MRGKVAVVGAGSRGTTVAATLARRVPTVLWARRPVVAEAVNARREDPDHLPGVALRAGPAPALGAEAPAGSPTSEFGPSPVLPLEAPRLP